MKIEIDGRSIGPGYEPYVICEISGNHNGSLQRALSLIEAAADTGADAIKIQSYTADTITIEHESEEFRIRGTIWDGATLHQLYKSAETPFEWHEPMFAKARELGITLFSSPFDESAVDLLASLDAPAYKIASFEIVDLPLIRKVARQGKPMIISTGMANLAETHEAVCAAREEGCDEIILLHCVSSYPAPDEDSNIRTIPHLGQAFDCVAGLSDHTMGSAVAVASIALGASVVEKHFTLARSDGGPDSEFSLEPQEFASLVTDCKRAWRALGSVGYDLKGAERGSVQFRRSLYVVQDVAAGEVITERHIRSIRPGYGLEPKYFKNIIGAVAARKLKRGEALAWDMLNKAH